MPESVVRSHLAYEQTQAAHSLCVETDGRSVDLDSSESSDPPSPKSSRDSSWLQVEVCRDFRRETCPRGSQCRFAHPDAKVMGRDGKVTCCYDFLKNRCNRDFCKYYHPPAHIKDRLVNAGRQFGAMMSTVPRYPPVQPVQAIGQCWDGYGVNAVSPMMFACMPSGDRLPICQEFLAGRCYHPMCPYVHPGPYVHHNVDQTVTVCRNFVRGWCAREDKCRFYHPPSHHYTPLQQAAILGIPNQGMPMVQPHVFPVYLPSSPPPSQAAPIIPVGGYPAVSLGSQSPVHVSSPFMPFVPMVPVIPPVLGGSTPVLGSASSPVVGSSVPTPVVGSSVPSPVVGSSVPTPFVPAEPVTYPTPVSIIDTTVTADLPVPDGEENKCKD